MTTDFNQGICPKRLTDEQKKTCQAILAEPPPANIPWKKIQDLLEAMPGFKVKQFSDRLFVTVMCGEKPRTGVFHSPSRQKCVASEHVRLIRAFLETVAIEQGRES